MIRLIKMNLYRAYCSRSTRILLIVTVAFGIFAGYVEKLDGDAMRKQYEKGDNPTGIGEVIDTEKPEETDEDVEAAMGFYVETPFHEDGSTPSILEYVCADLRAGLSLIVITIFAVIFVNAEDSSGFVKNIAGQVKRRWMLYASKLVVIMAFALGTMLLYAIMQGSTLYIMVDGISFGTDMIGDTIKYILTEWCLYSAFASGLALAVTVFHSTPIGITWGLLSSMGFGTIITGFINRVVDKSNFDIAEYFVTDNIKRLAVSGTIADYRYAFMIALVFFVVYNLLGMIWISKRDINA